MRRVFVLTVAVGLALTTGAAAAQEITEVPRGDSFSIENANECEPNAEVRATLTVPDGPDRVIGSALADAGGHFTVEASLPATTELGSAVVSVDCGLEDAVLEYEVTVVESTEIDYLEYAPYAAAALGALILVSLLVGWLRRRPKGDQAAKAEAKSVKADTKKAKAEAKSVNADAKAAKADAKKAKADAKKAKANPTSEKADVKAIEGPAEPSEDAPPESSGEQALADPDEADYWFWDNQTGNGPVKRLACLSTDGFYLHEVPASAFADLLEDLDRLGPDGALEQAFFSVPVANIDEVHHRGTQLRVTYQSGREKASRVIDLGTEVDGVIELLSRRVLVVSDAGVSSG